MGTVLRNVRIASRILIKTPILLLVVTIALGIAIGASTAIFSVVNAVLISPLPYDKPERIVMVWMDNRRMRVDRDIHSYPNYVDYRDQNQVFEHLAAYGGMSVNLTGYGEPERVIGASSTANLFQVLGVQPLHGRVFSIDEEQPGRDQVVVLGYGLWRRRFGGDSGILGQTVSLSDVSRTVIGIMPPDFKFPHRNAELWVPLAVDRNRAASRGAFSLYAIGRLKPEATLAQARSDLGRIAEGLEQQYPDILQGYGVNLVPLHDEVAGDMKPALLLLMGAVVFVLLIGCANIANLLLARAATREREMALRVALGAGRLRLVGQLLTESVMLALPGGICGLLLAKLSLRLFIVLSPEDLPRLDQVRIDSTVLVFSILVTLITGLIFGLVPALHASKIDLQQTLKESGRFASANKRSLLVRNGLAAFEVAVSLLLLAGAGLMIRSLAGIQDVDPGFHPDRLLTMNIQLSRTKYAGRLGAEFFGELIHRVETLPGVESAGGVTAVFIGRLPNSSNFSIEGRPAFSPSEQIEAPIDFATPGFFRTMGIPLLKGRDIDERDGLESQRVVVINQTFARRFWPDEEVLGKRMKFGSLDSNAPWLTIVGVVGDMRRTGLDQDVRCDTFLPYTQRGTMGFMSLVVRTKGDPIAMAGPVREQVWSLNPDQPISHVTTVDKLLGNMIATRRLNTVLFVMFAAIAAILAAVGVYGVMSYSVAQRKHELGIRMALGAVRSDIIRLVLKQGVLLSGIGVVFGLGLALALTRLMAGLLHQISASDPFTLAVVALALSIVSVAATVVPALRATKLDPLRVLRSE